ncbi:MAG: glycosyltransferase family 2 protein [Rubrivivax sp.]|nr:glycosyltransferase family 2 protein [Rubrivivax sp.]
MRTLACIITCHNRRDTTVRCLNALTAAKVPAGCSLQIYLVDDGSSDGTGDAVRVAYPQARVISGNGKLYWNGGMRVGFAAAMADGHDDYLWLNDDTVVDPDALLHVWACRQALAADAACIVVGATRDAQTSGLTYGGLYNSGKPWAHFYEKLPVSDKPQRCLAFNGNFVLISGVAAQRLGNLESGFIHALGDWDYGLRAHAAGVPCWVAPGFVGTCSHNAPVAFRPEAARSISARLRHVCDPKRYPPRVWLTYVRRHYPLLWPVYFARPYVGAAREALRAKLRAPGAGGAK